LPINEGAGDVSTAQPVGGAEPEHGQEAPSQAPAASGLDLRHRIDQVGAILAKGLDLAEAGVSLGVTIIGRVGAAAQQQLLRERAPAPGAVPAPPPAPQAGEAEHYAPAEPDYGITNRLPLTPGGATKISFSVNNDSTVEPKKVELRVEGFTGDAHRVRLDASAFSVRPAQKTIAPVDFEKFVLQVELPADTAPDIYRGAVVVTSGSELRIPVILVVTLP
jgi:hypothetical protein